MFKHFGTKLTDDEKGWFAGDGKEIRGSIKKGDKRGEVLVHLVEHVSGKTVAQDFYNGTKESEKPALRDLIEKSGLKSCKVTADALHLNPKTTGLIASSGGSYLIGLKENQEALLADMQRVPAYKKPVNQLDTIEKGHGRIDKRNYSTYHIGDEYFEARWDRSNIATLVVVGRTRMDLEGNIQMEETAYYLSNCPADEEGLMEAVRRHWEVEVTNHYRDVSFQEDKLKSKKNDMLKVVSTLRTLAVNIMKTINPKNMIAKMDFYQDKQIALFKDLRALNFL